MQEEPISTTIDEPSSTVPTSTCQALCTIRTNKNIVSVYRVGVKSEEDKSDVPFVQFVSLLGPKGEVVRMRSVFDDGTMINAIDTAVFRSVAGRLAPLKHSDRILRMANGQLVASDGVWEGEVRVAEVVRRGSFEVFSGGGAWSLLFGKPMLRIFDASHAYKEDVVHLPTPGGSIQLPN
ncbi:hypothetical protein CPC08DRAFT_650899, partial [Agrocybe pediades]